MVDGRRRGLVQAAAAAAAIIGRGSFRLSNMD